MKQIVLVLLTINALADSQINLKTPKIPNNGVLPKGGFVSSAEIAVMIAEAVLVPVYGSQTIVSERPFKAALNGNIWIVKGTVPCEGPPDAVCPGGAGEVWISKRTGQILYMTHDQ